MVSTATPAEMLASVLEGLGLRDGEHIVIGTNARTGITTMTALDDASNAAITRYYHFIESETHKAGHQFLLNLRGSFATFTDRATLTLGEAKRR